MLLSTTFRLKQNRRLCPLRDGHDDDDGVFGIPPVAAAVIANICKIGGSALRENTP